jgi:hypothetical protein
MSRSLSAEIRIVALPRSRRSASALIATSASSILLAMASGPSGFVFGGLRPNMRISELVVLS